MMMLRAVLVLMAIFVVLFAIRVVLAGRRRKR